MLDDIAGINVEPDPLLDELDHWLKHREVVKLRSAGLTVREISEQMGAPQRTVYRWIAEAANAIRRENRSFTQEMFLAHVYRLERLYQIVQQRIDEAGFSRDAVRAAIDILDRQSKLLDLDRSKSYRGRNDWMDDAKDEELIAEARRLGLHVPEKFDVPPEKAS